MADLLQKMFQIHVRPYYINSTGNKTFYSGKVYGDLVVSGNGTRYELVTNNSGSTDTSPNKINKNGKFDSDPWFLHSVYSSYNEFRANLKSVIAVYGTDNVRCSIYVPIDYEVLPNQ
jgi:hypothetical protein